MRHLKQELWPYMITVGNTSENYDREVWLEENMGPFKGRWNVVYRYTAVDFYFRNSKDATIFTLRWS